MKDLKILGEDTEASWVSSSGVKNRVTVDMVKLQEVTVAEDKQTKPSTIQCGRRCRDPSAWQQTLAECNAHQHMGVLSPSQPITYWETFLFECNAWQHSELTKVISAKNITNMSGPARNPPNEVTKRADEEQDRSTETEAQLHHSRFPNQTSLWDTLVPTGLLSVLLEFWVSAKSFQIFLELPP